MAPAAAFGAIFHAAVMTSPALGGPALRVAGVLADASVQHPHFPERFNASRSSFLIKLGGSDDKDHAADSSPRAGKVPSGSPAPSLWPRLIKSHTSTQVRVGP